MSDLRGNTSATYDNRGRILTQTDITGRQLTNSYNNLGQLTGATDNSGAGGASYTFTVDGQTATCTYPNGTKILYGYDIAGRLTTLKHTVAGTGAVLIGYTALYDNGNRVTQITEQPSGDVTVFSYDGANNLLSETRTGTKPYSGTYTYDRSNRRKTALVITNGVTTHHGAYTYDGAGRLLQVVDSATGLTEVYTWNNDGTLASSPGPSGSGYSLLFDYDEEQHLIRIKHNTGGVITTAYEYGYGADGGRRWQKDYAHNVWTWYPCGVACNAGELVEQTSDLTGATWTTSALYLKSGRGCQSQIIRRNSEYHHSDIQGSFAVVTNASSAIIKNNISDVFRTMQYVNSSAQTPWVSTSSRKDNDGLITGRSGSGSYLASRDLFIALGVNCAFCAIFGPILGPICYWKCTHSTPPTPPVIGKPPTSCTDENNVALCEQCLADLNEDCNKTHDRISCLARLRACQGVCHEGIGNGQDVYHCWQAVSAAK